MDELQADALLTRWYVSLEDLMGTAAERRRYALLQAAAMFGNGPEQNGFFDTHERCVVAAEQILAIIESREQKEKP